MSEAPRPPPTVLVFLSLLPVSVCAAPLLVGVGVGVVSVVPDAPLLELGPGDGVFMASRVKPLEVQYPLYRLMALFKSTVALVHLSRTHEERYASASSCWSGCQPCPGIRDGQGKGLVRDTCEAFVWQARPWFWSGASMRTYQVAAADTFVLNVPHVAVNMIGKVCGANSGQQWWKRPIRAAASIMFGQVVLSHREVHSQGQLTIWTFECPIVVAILRTWSERCVGWIACDSRSGRVDHLSIE
jgi:hypothetical protein